MQIIHAPPHELFEARRELLDYAKAEDYTISFAGSWLEGGEEKFTKWYSSEEWYRVLSYPAVHRSLLKNEIVFEFDEDLKKARLIVEALETYGAKPLVGFSGGRGFHVHVWLVRDQEVYRKYVDIIAKYGFTIRDVCKAIVKAISSFVKIDTGVVLSSRHMIREFYSLHPSGYMKIPVDELRPVRVRFGAKIEPMEVSKETLPFWKPPEDFLDTVFELMVEYAKKEEEEWKRRKKQNKQIKVKEIKWIEWILAHPERVRDGRRRLLMYAIIPYLITVKGFSNVEVEKICMEWVEKTPKQDKMKNRYYDYLIKSEIKAVSKSGVLPMARKKFFKIFRELKYLEAL